MAPNEAELKAQISELKAADEAKITEASVARTSERAEPVARAGLGRRVEHDVTLRRRRDGPPLERSLDVGPGDVDARVCGRTERAPEQHRERRQRDATQRPFRHSARALSA